MLFMTLTSPFGVLGDPDTNKVVTNVGDGSAPLRLTEVFIFLRHLIYGASAIVAVSGLIVLLFFKKNDRLLAEQKAKVTKAIAVVWLAASAVTLFNILKAFLDGLFGFA